MQRKVPSGWGMMLSRISRRSAGVMGRLPPSPVGTLAFGPISRSAGSKWTTELRGTLYPAACSTLVAIASAAEPISLLPSESNFRRKYCPEASLMVKPAVPPSNLPATISQGPLSSGRARPGPCASSSRVIRRRKWRLVYHEELGTSSRALTLSACRGPTTPRRLPTRRAVHPRSRTLPTWKKKVWSAMSQTWFSSISAGSGIGLSSASNHLTGPVVSSGVASAALGRHVPEASSSAASRAGIRTPSPGRTRPGRPPRRCGRCAPPAGRRAPSAD